MCEMKVRARDRHSFITKEMPDSLLIYCPGYCCDSFIVKALGEVDKNVNDCFPCLERMTHCIHCKDKLQAEQKVLPAASLSALPPGDNNFSLGQAQQSVPWSITVKRKN